MAKRSGCGFVVTCEHGGNRIPREYRHLFAKEKNILDTHRGWDPGALGLANRIATHFRAPFFYSTTSRLLVDLNRSINNRRTLFSKFTRPLPNEERARILDRFYIPYRMDAEEEIRNQVETCGRVFHLSVHTFTPELYGEVRNADFAPLYDPRRKTEKRVAAEWISTLRSIDPSIPARRNYPYTGVRDGFVPFLRTQFKEKEYCGIEIELNHRDFAKKKAAWKNLENAVFQSLVQIFAGI